MLPTDHSVELDPFLEEDIRDFHGSSSNHDLEARTPYPPAHKRDFAIGIGLIVVVASLWTISGFVTQVSTSSSSLTVWQHLHCYHRTFIEAATINHSCMPESFVL